MSPPQPSPQAECADSVRADTIVTPVPARSRVPTPSGAAASKDDVNGQSHSSHAQADDLPDLACTTHLCHLRQDKCDRLMTRVTDNEVQNPTPAVAVPPCCTIRWTEFSPSPLPPLPIPTQRQSRAVTPVNTNPISSTWSPTGKKAQTSFEKSISRHPASPFPSPNREEASEEDSFTGAPEPRDYTEMFNLHDM
ncbi:hypothetical protein FIBSPDRAFT_900786 [Athelia psychrophila]|uniref:Uncharacterized protein n=1 Tax=Athelia psychrophila TaxID=1759441 RepID=A0A165Y067_9AGAM|nr:hypothetical protein FIBSPDRAFT_900786 [Fibularhizoctonia sp. CBS 109695]